MFDNTLSVRSNALREKRSFLTSHLPPVYIKSKYYKVHAAILTTIVTANINKRHSYMQVINQNSIDVSTL